MSLLDQVLKHNETFVKEKQYEAYATTKFPDKKMVILTCMDTRLSELLPRAMNVNQGEAKIIKNAGAVISHPYGSIMRSILVSIYELNADEVYVIGHEDCGMSALNKTSFLEKVKERGIPSETIQALEKEGISLDKWLTGFEKVEESVADSVKQIKSHPLLPDIPVHGLVICPETGRLEVVHNGYVADDEA